MQDDSDSMSRDSSNSDGQLQNAQSMQKKRKPGKNGSFEVKGHFTCGCFKVFTSYRSLYVHILHRHGGEFPKNTRIVCNRYATSIDRYQDSNGDHTSLIRFADAGKIKPRLEGTLLGLLEADIDLLLKRLGISVDFRVNSIYLE